MKTTKTLWRIWLCLWSWNWKKIKKMEFGINLTYFCYKKFIIFYIKYSILFCVLLEISHSRKLKKHIYVYHCHTCFKYNFFLWGTFSIDNLPLFSCRCWFLSINFYRKKLVSIKSFIFGYAEFYKYNKLNSLVFKI